MVNNTQDKQKTK